MRPRVLNLQAFGSYGTKLEIDFNRLGQHGIFAISGPTGAGKSTIFDAIVYALYDDLPGFRDGGNIRSQYAEPDFETKVSLTFEADREEWTVTRTPARDVPKKRGEGTTHKPGGVILERTDSKQGGLTGKSANNKILDLIGLTKEQFQQVVLIPQGKFEEVLKADTAEREKLLKKLFPIGIFSNITERLKEIQKKREDEFDEAARAGEDREIRLNEALNKAVGQIPEEIEHQISKESLGLEEFDLEKIGFYVEELSQIAKEFDRVLSEQKKVAEKDLLAWKTAEAAKQEWQKWQDCLTKSKNFLADEEKDRRREEKIKSAEDITTLLPAITEWEQSTAELKKIEPKIKSLKDELSKLNISAKDKSSLEKSNSAYSLLQRLIDDVEKLEVAEVEYERLYDEKESIINDGEELTDQLEEYQISKKDLKENQDSLKVKNEERGVLQKQTSGLSKLQADFEKLEKQVSDAKEIEKSNKSLKTKEQNQKTAIKKEEAAKEKVAKLGREVRLNIAAEVAESLEDGVACPACGATDHPNPAKRKSGSATQEDVTKAEAIYAAATEDRRKIENDIAVLKSVIKTLGNVGILTDLQKKLTVEEKNLKKVEELEESIEELEESIEELEESIEEENGQIIELDKQLNGDKRELEQRKTRFEKDKKKYIEIHGGFVSVEKKRVDKEKSAKYVEGLAKNLEQYEEKTDSVSSAMNSLTPKMKELKISDPSKLSHLSMPTADIKTEKKALADRLQDRNATKQFLEDYREKKSPTDCPEVALLLKAKKGSGEIYQESSESRGSFKDALAIITNAPSEMGKGKKETDSLRKKFEEAQTLAKLCDGQAFSLVGKKQSLENWILADYLEQVLGQANLRLEKMMNGRYSMKIDDESTSGQKATGLDLSVFDVETGQDRPAKTLSGGETFMASLSLALGLADVVASGSNNDMGALFVDEGFGSLDSQALDAVVEVLQTLEAGNRIVGVISHVDELKQALPNGITIQHSVSGSAATINYPEI
jgi:exonuclease SbcC